MSRLTKWEKTDAGQIFTGWLMIFLGGATLLWVYFNGLDELATPRSILGVIVSPILLIIGFWKLSGAEDD